MARLKTAILISGRGSNMRALIEACRAPAAPAEIVLVLSNNPGAGGLSYATTAGIATIADAALGRRVIHTVSRPDDLAGLLDAQREARFVLELETSMRRHGMTAQQLWSLARTLRGGRLEGVALGYRWDMVLRGPRATPMGV